MATTLRYVDPTREAGPIARLYAAVAATCVSRFVSRYVSWKLDPLLLRATGGRLATTLVFPTAVLETTGAKTGVRRRNAVIYFHDGDRVTIVASNAGSARHPSWYYNLRAQPDIIFGGTPMRARGRRQSRARPIVAARRSGFPAFANYRRAAAKMNRRIPIVQLTQR